MVLILYLIAFVIGLAFGSFLNCLVYRLACQKTIFGRSFCPRCQKKIAWFDNFPLFSFILLKGWCRHCQERISWQYPIVELIMGLLFVLPVWRFYFNTGNFLFFNHPSFYLELVRDWIIFFALVFTFVYDLKYLKIEDIVLLPSAGLVFILNLFSQPLVNSLAGMSILSRAGHMLLAILIGVSFFGLQYLFTKGKGIGLGDLRIGIFMGAVLAHWSGLCLALVISYIIGALVSLFLIVFKKKSLKSQVPLGPFLVGGTFIVFVFGQQIINWYFHLSF